MFYGRKDELKELVSEINRDDCKSAILVYGKRRVGKSTLINEASKSFEGIVINYSCINSTYEGNLSLLYRYVSDALSLPSLSFESIFSMFKYLETIKKSILVIIDEYPYLKQSGRKGEIDSIMQAVIDHLPKNVKIILCGSYVSIMKELLEESNPLFGRFSLIQHVKDFDYYDSALFYPELDVHSKIAFYSVFGGSPYVLSTLDYGKTLKENIISMILKDSGIIKSHVENIILTEIQKNYDVRILESIGNGKRKYSEIRDIVSRDDKGLLDKQLKTLLDMETIVKTEPINRRNDKKKRFYSIEDNLLRFYFTFVFGRAGTITRIGEELYFKNNIENAINQFISRRFEDVALQYFHRMAVKGVMSDIEDFGSYWYDNPINKNNGEFDVVIKRFGDLYDFYECKYYKKPMSLDECKKEEEQLNNIQGIDVANIGFVSASGFSFKKHKGYTLIDGDMLYT